MDLYYGNHEHNLSGDDIDESAGYIKCPECGRKMRKIWAEIEFWGVTNNTYKYVCTNHKCENYQE